jgi:N-acetylglucosamine-6-phosphate deacetylase
MVSPATSPPPSRLRSIKPARLWNALPTPSKRPKAFAGNGDAVQARPLGIHLEGPFLSHKRRGVHPPEYLVEPTLQVFERLWQAARGHVRMMTIAPELPGALEVIAEAARATFA